MIFKSSDVSPVPAFGSARRKTLAVGESMMVVEFDFPPAGEVPVHSHPYEEVGYLVSGALKVRIGSHEEVLGPGDSWFIPTGTEHNMSTEDGAVFVAVFSPPRKDYR